VIGDGSEVEYRAIPSEPGNGIEKESRKEEEVNMLQNVCWKEFGLLVFVWVAFLAIQIAMVCYFSLNIFFNRSLFCTYTMESF